MDGGDTEDRFFKQGILPTETMYREFLATSLEKSIEAVEEMQRAFLDIDEDYLQEIKYTQYQKLEGTKAGDHVRGCFANPHRDCAFVEDAADLLELCGDMRSSSCSLEFSG